MANDLVSGRKSSYRMEKRYVRVDGSVVWGLLNRAIVREKRGQPPYFISQIVDITEQRKIIEMKSEFVATVSCSTAHSSNLDPCGAWTLPAPLI